MRSGLILAIAAFGLLCAWATPNFAQGRDKAARLNSKEELRLGQRVLIKEGVVVRVDGQEVNFERDFEFPPEIMEIDGDRIRLAKAWVKRRDIVTIDDSLRHYEIKLKSNANSVTDLIWRGVCLGEKGQLPEALADLNKANQIDRKNACALRRRGQVKAALKDYEGALKDLERALAIDDESVAGHLVRAQLHLDKENYERALSDLNRCAELDPSYAVIAQNAAFALHFQGRHANAKLKISEAIELDSHSAECQMLKMMLEAESGDFESAMESINRAIELRPNHGEYRSARGTIYLSLNDINRASVDADKAAELGAKSPSMPNLAAMVKFSRGDEEGAIKQLEDTVKQFPEDILAYRSLFNLRMMRDECKLVLEYLGAGVEHRAHDPELWFYRAIALSKTNQAKPALESANKAIELNPKYFEALTWRGDIKANLGDHDGAFADFARAIQLKPKYWNAYCSRADLKRDSGRLSEALNDYNEVLLYEPENWRALAGRGFTSHLIGDEVGADIDYQDALKVDSSDALTYTRRILLLTTCKKPSKRNLDVAEQLCERLIEVAPDEAETDVAKACLLALQGDFEAAIDAQKEALKDKAYAEERCSIVGAAAAKARIAAWERGELWTYKKR